MAGTPELVGDCPRCGARKITFDLKTAKIVRIEYGWQNWYESYCLCRGCGRGTIFILSESVNGNYEYVHHTGLMNIQGGVNKYLTVERFVSLKDETSIVPPEYLPKDIEAVFQEASTCLTVGCYNAAGTMFRLCIDLATRAILPNDEGQGPPFKVRRDLGLRLPWLFEKGLLPADLKELSSSVREDGNDGAHAGTLKKADAEDLLDFTGALLERIYTEPERIKLAKKRRDERRKG